MRFVVQPQIHAILFTLLGDGKFTSGTFLGEIRQLHLHLGLTLCVQLLWCGFFFPLTRQQCEICRLTVCVQLQVLEPSSLSQVQPATFQRVGSSSSFRFWNPELSAESIRLIFVYSSSFMVSLGVLLSLSLSLSVSLSLSLSLSFSLSLSLSLQARYNAQ